MRSNIVHVAEEVAEVVASASAPATVVFDPWEIKEFVTSEPKWTDRSIGDRIAILFVQILKILLTLCLLYLFITSLSLLANSFRILGGKAAGRAFRDTELLDNPIAALAAVVLATVFVQSSSTCTAIIISMTAGGLIKIENSIPMIMGANIGTAITNTIVSLGHMGDINEYRRAFAGATVHDMFNFLNVCIFFPLECMTGVLRRLAEAVVTCFGVSDEEEEESDTMVLKAIVKPLNNRILDIDSKLISKIAEAQTKEERDRLDESSIIKHQQGDDNHMFLDTPMSDTVAGILMAFISLGFLMLSLILMVKVLQSIFRGHVAIWVRNFANLETPAVPGLANYLLVGCGAVMTLIFQSSSVTTSTLTPLVGIGLVRLDKMFAFTVGANVATCVTGILSALVTDQRKTALTVAFSHLLFNVLGTIVWYPIPAVRNIPIAMARVNGNLAADKPWWPCMWIFIFFLATPGFYLAISAISPWLLLSVGLPLAVAFFGVIALLALRLKRPHRLPPALQQDPDWLPHSLCITQARLNHPPANTVEALEEVSHRLGLDSAAGDWQSAPFAWGAGWLIIFALILALANAKWADIKLPRFDGRDHVGFSAWSVCNYGFQRNDMHWARPYDESDCDDSYINKCATLTTMNRCRKVSFSNNPGINEEYEESWKSCRERCPMYRWSSWCEAQMCGGSLHKEQCQNVSDAVRRAYVVSYGPSDRFASAKAWTKGERCRKLDNICDNSEALNTAGDLGCIALGFAISGHLAVLTYSSLHKARNLKWALCLALICWALMWMFSLASWVYYLSLKGRETTCVVEDESRRGAVLATAPFEVIAQESYSFGCVLGCWILSFVVIGPVAIRLVTTQFRLGTSNLGSSVPRDGEDPRYDAEDTEADDTQQIAENEKGPTLENDGEERPPTRTIGHKISL